MLTCRLLAIDVHGLEPVERDGGPMDHELDPVLGPRDVGRQRAVMGARSVRLARPFLAGLAGPTRRDQEHVIEDEYVDLHRLSALWFRAKGGSSLGYDSALNLK